VERFKTLQVRSDGRVEILLWVVKDNTNELNGIIVDFSHISHLFWS
jgi:hypothetical protein